MSDERGFSLLEVIVATVLFGIIVTLAVPALRHYWMVQSLDGAADAMVSQLRQVQSRSMAESHPLVYGVRVRVEDERWGIVLFDPGLSSATSDDTCEEIATGTFDSGMFSSRVEVAAAGFAGTGEIHAQSFCRSALGATDDDHFVMFFARGTATAGEMTLRHPTLDRTRTLSVSPLTGRVTRG